MASFEAFDKLSAIRDRESLRQDKVTKELARLARHTNPRKAKRALKTLYSLFRFDKTFKYEVLGPVADILRDDGGHSIVRIKAAEVLGNMCVAKELQDQSALDTLIRTTKPSDKTPPEVAKASLIAAGRIGDPRARSAVRDSLSYTNVKDKDAQEDIRAAAIEALGSALEGAYAKEWVDRSLGSRVGDLLRDKKLAPDTRTKLLRLAGLIQRNGQTIPGLDSTLFSSLASATDPASIMATMETIAKTGNEKAVSAFLAVFNRFKDTEDEQNALKVRGAVCAVTGTLLSIWSNEKFVPKKGVAQAVELLIKGMMDSDASVRTQAVINLGNLYDTRCDRKKAAQALVAIAAAKGMSQTIQKNAIDSLEAVTGRVLGDKPARWETWISKRKNLLSLGPKTRRRGR
jgi:HEAT repeat protein